MVKQKVWYKSKAKIGAICVAIGAVGSWLTGSIDIGTAVMTISGALGVFGIRDAQK